LLEGRELEIGHLVAIKRVALSTLPLTRDLTNIAAQLSTRHMRCWIAIVEATSRLSEADTRAQVENHLQELLKQLSRFDGLAL
jgi:hypothetical protein